MKKIHQYVATLGLVALCGTGVRAEDAALKSELQARLDGFCHAVNTRNVTELKGHIPDDARFQLSAHEVVDAPAFLKMVAQTEETVKDLKLTAVLKTLNPTQAGVWGIAAVTTVGKLQDSKGKWHRIEVLERAMIAWRQTDAGYVLDRVTLLTVSSKVDGKTVARTSS